MERKVQNVKMKNAYCRTWNMEIKLKYMKDEKSTSKTRNMVKNLGKLGKNSTVGLEIWQKN